MPWSGNVINFPRCADQPQEKAPLRFIQVPPELQQGKFVRVFDDLIGLWRANRQGRAPVKFVQRHAKKIR